HAAGLQPRLQFFPIRSCADHLLRGGDLHLRLAALGAALVWDRRDPGGDARASDGTLSQRRADRRRHRPDRGARSAAAGLSGIFAGLVLTAPRAEKILQYLAGFHRMMIELLDCGAMMAC